MTPSPGAHLDLGPLLDITNSAMITEIEVGLAAAVKGEDRFRIRDHQTTFPQAAMVATSHQESHREVQKCR